MPFLTTYLGCPWNILCKSWFQNSLRGWGMSYQGSNNVENNTKMLEKVEKMIEQQ